jgi:cell wall-associated NlpC family hydrolase
VAVRFFRAFPLLLALMTLAGCVSAPRHAAPAFVFPHPAQRQEVVLYAIGLLDTGYRFGGRNPDAGLDCSGMVSHVVERVSGLKLPHNAAAIATRTRPIGRDALAPGDLVFFNTANRRHSHMGIYIGEGRFIHAPSNRGAVRIEKLDSAYYASRLDGLRTLAAKE